MSRPRFELRTFCVLDRCDNQLRHRPMGDLSNMALSRFMLELAGVIATEFGKTVVLPLSTHGSSYAPFDHPQFRTRRIGGLDAVSTMRHLVSLGYLRVKRQASSLH